QLYTIEKYNDFKLFINSFIKNRNYYVAYSQKHNWRMLVFLKQARKPRVNLGVCLLLMLRCSG
ncbi:hypothetical protein, partial [Acetobacter orientalis]|uniref:hypothetical protein n=1 Tax=Acetobacter orientalis TaxID=146474 RepID=UPI0039EBF466